MAKSTQTPTGEGVKDLPAVPGSLYKGNAPALGVIASVPNKTSPQKGQSS